jgi:hypothetical protein
MIGASSLSAVTLELLMGLVLPGQSLSGAPVASRRERTHHPILLGVDEQLGERSDL